MNLDKEIFEISTNDIMPNRFQPREMFDDKALDELASSIKEHGVIQPIIVRKVGDKYEIIAGERRYRASKLAGKTTIPAIVKDMDDKEAAKVALLENLQRKDLTPIEEAKTYQTILKLDNMTQEELANNLGKAQSTIANKLRLLQLDDEVQTALLNEKISERHARSLLNIDDKEQQKQLLNQVIINRMTVKQLDDEISRITGKHISSESDQSFQQIPSTNYASAETTSNFAMPNTGKQQIVSNNLNDQTNQQVFVTPAAPSNNNNIVDEKAVMLQDQNNSQNTEVITPNYDTTHQSSEQQFNKETSTFQASQEQASNNASPDLINLNNISQTNNQNNNIIEQNNQAVNNNAPANNTNLTSSDIVQSTEAKPVELSTTNTTTEQATKQNNLSEESSNLSTNINLFDALREQPQEDNQTVQNESNKTDKEILNNSNIIEQPKVDYTSTTIPVGQNNSEQQNTVNYTSTTIPVVQNNSEQQNTVNYTSTTIPVNQNNSEQQNTVNHTSATIPAAQNTSGQNNNISSAVSNQVINNIATQSVGNQVSSNENTSNNSEQNVNYNEIYDLRFAINNVRQAVQTTEKFGFKVNVEEFDLADVYQIVIKIDKNK